MKRLLAELTVILVTKDSAEALSAFLCGLEDPVLSSLLLVDNSSQDQTMEIASSNSLRTLSCGANLGFAAAANRGARAADTGLLCFVNPDCSPCEELLESGVRAVVEHPGAIASPLIEEGPLGSFPGRQPGYTRAKLLVDVLITNYGSAETVRRLGHRENLHDRTWYWPHGACFFVAKDFFLGLGGFDERFFLYMEDVDLGRRLYKAGGKVVDVCAQVAHRVGKSSKTGNSRRLRYLNGGRCQYAAKYYGNGFASLLRMLALPATVGRSLLEGKK